MTALRGKGSCVGWLEKGMFRTLQLGENSFSGWHAVSGGLRGFTLFLMEQTVFMECEQMSFLWSKPPTYTAVKCGGHCVSRPTSA